MASGGGRNLTLHVKGYGAWTSRLLARLRGRRALALRFSGPMGAERTADCALTPPPRWQAHDVLVLICGGVGVTPMLSLLRAAALQRLRAAATGEACLPRRVVCVWCARAAAEFVVLDRGLVAEAAAGDWLSLHLHVTGEGKASSLKSRVAMRDSAGSLSCSIHASASGAPAPAPAPGAAPAPLRLPRQSAFGWSLLR